MPFSQMLFFAENKKFPFDEEPYSCYFSPNARGAKRVIFVNLTRIPEGMQRFWRHI